MVFEKVQSIIAEQLAITPDEVQMDTDVTEDLEADSLDLFQIISDLEDEFGVELENYENISTVADVVKLVEDAQDS